MDPSVILVGIDGVEHPLVRDLVERHGYIYAEQLRYHGRDQFNGHASVLLHLTDDPMQPVVIRDGFHVAQFSAEHLRLLRRLTRARGVLELLLDERTAPYDYAWDVLQSPPSAGLITSMSCPRLPDGAIGNPRGRFLLIGEQVNQRGVGPDLPFFSDRAAARYLNGCLAEAGFREDELLLMNALTAAGDASTMPEGRFVRIALGQVASKLLRSTGSVPKLDHVLPHPAFWRRFHAREREVYVGALRRIREGALGRLTNEIGIQGSISGPA